jgi:uncharacterized membrane protein YqhA
MGCKCQGIKGKKHSAYLVTQQVSKIAKNNMQTKKSITNSSTLEALSCSLAETVVVMSAVDLLVEELRLLKSISFLWCHNPNRPQATSMLRFLDQTQLDTSAPGRTLNE